MQLTGHPALVIVLISALWIAIFFASTQIWYRFVIQYRFGRRSLLITLLGLVPITWLGYEHIKSVEMVRMKDIWGDVGLLFGALKAGNRPFARFALVIRSRGFLSAVIITPDDPIDFARQIMERVTHSR